MKDRADHLREEERRKKEMDEAEKLRPVTLIRSSQGHRFIKKVTDGDELMANELEQQRQIIDYHS